MVDRAQAVRRSRRLAFAAILLCLTTACGSDTPATTDCSVAGENAQILPVMRSWYYWYQSVPGGLDPAAYAKPQALLDAIRKQQPLDRFSFIVTKQANQAFYGAGQYIGFGFGLRFNETNALQVTQVFPDAPADQAGFERGDTITAVNGTPIATLIANDQLGMLGADFPGVMTTFTFTNRQQVSRTVTLTSAVVTQPTVAEVTVLDVRGHRVGYILFNSFITPSIAALDQAFAQLASEGATELVIDERYNGGGAVNVAQHLASLVTGGTQTGKVLGTLSYNDLHTNQNQSLTLPAVTTSLGLTRVFFITTGSSASASEFIINALRPYLPVVTVGSRTFGKPVGENGFEICSDVLYPITFKIVNAQGAGDYFDGLAPSCAASDDITHALGDPEEESLATALEYVRSGDCGPQAAAAARAAAARETVHPRRAVSYGWRQLVGAY